MVHGKPYSAGDEEQLGQAEEARQFILILQRPDEPHVLKVVCTRFKRCFRSAISHDNERRIDASAQHMTHRVQRNIYTLIGRQAPHEQNYRFS